MARQLVAYDEHGKKVATLDFMVARDDQGNVVGLVDFEAHAEAGGKLRDIWNVEGAVRSALEAPAAAPEGRKRAKGTPAHLPIRRAE